MWQRAAFFALSFGCSVAVSAMVARDRPIDAWDTFNKQATLQCPSLGLASKPAGDVDYLQERFYTTLSKNENSRFEKAVPRIDGGPAPCSKRNGISCPTAWNMLAIKRAGLLTRFTAYACSTGDRAP